MQLVGRRVLVTGASRGIGEHLARHCARAGADVALVARSEELLSKLVADMGGRAYPADLADPAQVAGLLARVEADGPVDVVINNAAVDHTGPLAGHADGQIAAQLQLNLATPIDLVRQAVPGMTSRGRGHIVNISSVAGSYTAPGLAVYSSSKAGLSHFTGCLRAELKGLPITTTLVELGPTRTGMWDDVIAYPPTARAIRRFAHLGLVSHLEPDAVAAAVVAAVQRDRRHVRLPRRDAILPIFAEAPRRLTEWLLAGVDARP